MFIMKYNFVDTPSFELHIWFIIRIVGVARLMNEEEVSSFTGFMNQVSK